LDAIAMLISPESKIFTVLPDSEIPQYVKSVKMVKIGIQYSLWHASWLRIQDFVSFCPI
jgi:hypothetical protein